MIATKTNADYMRKRELEALERAPVAQKLDEPKHGFSRCAGELA